MMVPSPQNDLIPIHRSSNRGPDRWVLVARHEQLVGQGSGYEQAQDGEQDRSHGGLLPGKAYPKERHFQSPKGPPGLGSCPIQGPA